MNRTRVTDAGLAHLSAMPGLMRLRLANTEVSDAGLAKLAALSSLIEIDLSGTNITDGGLKLLATAKWPTGPPDLYIKETKCTNAGVAALQRAWPSWKIVR